MKKNDVFIFTAPNGVEVTAIVIGKYIIIMNEEEYRKAVAKSQAKAHAEVWCRCYGLPVEAIEETENSFVFKVEFKF